MTANEAPAGTIRRRTPSPESLPQDGIPNSSGLFYVKLLEEAALEYVARGWHVFPCHGIADGRCTCGRSPCRDAGKHPRTAHGLSDASADPAAIRDWWQRWPLANVAIATGPSGLVVVDPDRPKRPGDPDGLAAWSDLAARLQLTDTLTARTGGGGLHVIYGAAPGHDIRNTRGDLPAGIHVRANGGYIIAAPSLHESGRRYGWVDPAMPVAPLPALLYRLLTTRRPQTQGPPLADEALCEGERNAGLFRLGCRLRRDGLSDPALLAALLAENTARCRPPLDEREVERIAGSLCRYPMGGDTRHVSRLRIWRGGRHA